MTAQQVAILITGLSHVGAAAVLLLMLVRLGGSRPEDQRGWWDSDGGSGDSPVDGPDKGPRGGGLPLPDAEPSSTRLRGPGTIAPSPGARRGAPHKRPLPERDSEPSS